MKISGKVKVVQETQEVGTTGFKKRLIVVATDEQYSQSIPIDFVQDKCSKLDNIQVGEEVTIDVNLRGNEYNGKYYVSLQGWQIAKNTTPEKAPAPKSEPESDLPF